MNHPNPFSSSDQNEILSKWLLSLKTTVFHQEDQAKHFMNIFTDTTILSNIRYKIDSFGDFECDDDKSDDGLESEQSGVDQYEKQKTDDEVLDDDSSS